jgi:hypothetical protein
LQGTVRALTGSINVKNAILILFLCAAAHMNAEVQSQVVNLETGQPLNLETFGGPSVQLIVTNYDSHDVTFTTVDFERTVVSGGYSRPGRTSQQVPITSRTLIFRRGDFAVLYGGSPSMNHVLFYVLRER